MKRVCITLPPTLELRAKAAAKKGGVSFSQWVRQSLEKDLSGDLSHPFLDPDFGWDGPVPKDGARNHDKYLYGEGFYRKKPSHTRKAK